MASTADQRSRESSFISPQQIQVKFELGVGIALFNWPALTLAVQNGWGGPESESKREWFAGAVVEMFEQRPETDLEDVETTLLQVMLDEFEVNVEDDTAYEMAQAIMKIRTTTLEGNFSFVDMLQSEWLAKKGKPAAVFKKVERDEPDDDTDWDSDGMEEDEDEDMEDAPELVDTSKKSKRPELEIDEDGFTKVVGKKKRG